MKQFLDENFLLSNKWAEELYHGYAKEMPIIDYHNHLPPAEIAADKQFQNLTQIWLNGDHYKWRAMRANGVTESYCTGNKPDSEKFLQWAGTVPYTMRNPLYHWTHLELQRYFGIDTILNEQTATGIYEECNAKLQTPAFSVKNLLRKMNVKLVCTTDDPADDLQYHQQINNDGFDIAVLPAFRPDEAMNVDNAQQFMAYCNRLEAVANVSINNYQDYLDALKSRHDFFAANGCSVSDHGLPCLYASEYTEADIQSVFNMLRAGKNVGENEKDKFRSAMLVQFAEWDFEKGWVQQFHLGAMRNNNQRMYGIMGANTGWDSIGDYNQGIALSKFLSRLDAENHLTKTILYNLNPADNALFATMGGNFNDGSVWGKVQWGSAWWFLDQKEGMTEQLNTLSNMGLLSRFVGMLTDSRSFLSFPRHEYFRRILCNLLGQEIERGELPDDVKWIGKLIGDICYHNTKNYFNWQHVV